MKVVLLRCKGKPHRITFEKIGGPFLEETEVWDYSSSSETAQRDDFWFSHGRLSSMPLNSPMLEPSSR